MPGRGRPPVKASARRGEISRFDRDYFLLSGNQGSFLIGQDQSSHYGVTGLRRVRAPGLQDIWIQEPVGRVTSPGASIPP